MDPVKRAAGFEVSLTLQLPRDRLSVPLARRLVRSAMAEVGVVSEDSEAVQLALTEACTNVVSHAGPGDEYEVSVVVGPVICELRVVDRGVGFAGPTGKAMPRTGAEHGRGLALMRALVDRVQFESEPAVGTVVRLVKALSFDDSVPGRKLVLESMRAAT